MPASPLTLELTVDPRVTLAGWENDVPPVRRLVLCLHGDAPLGPVTVSIRADPDFAAPWSVTVAELRPGARHRVEPVDLVLRPSALHGARERQRATWTAEARSGDTLLAAITVDVELLAPTEWPGGDCLPELLAAFVTPNHPALAPVLAEAAIRLAESTGDAALDGYQTRSRERVVAITEALYDALRARALRDINPPASFERAGQKVRLPHTLLEEGHGTCLDLSLLVAALLEQVGLHPMVCLVDGHALVGVWLDDRTLAEPATDDPTLLGKLLALGEALLIDPTGLTSDAPLSAAMRAAAAHLEPPERFGFAVDVVAARRQFIRPLPLAADGALAPSTRAAPASAPRSPIVLPPPAPVPGPAAPADRMARWKSRLLDLSLRNRLLNFRETKTSVLLPGLDLAAFEGALARGEAPALLPKPGLLGDRDPRDPATLAARVGEDTLAAHLQAEQARGRLHATLDPGPLDVRLLELHRRAAAHLRETGAITVFAAVGMLRWFESDGHDTPRMAPLLLLPVELVRPPAGGTWRVRAADDEARFNVTLLRKLEADFGLVAPGLAELPESGAGVDVAGMLQAVLRLIRDRPRWDVRQEVWLGRFTFTRFLMWLDLEARADQLLANPVVRHLFEGDGAALPLAAPLLSEAELDHARAAGDNLTVLDADPSQLQAIFAAEDGSSFVLQGPPGTGKSQTITNLVAQMLGRGRTVLFVSEKRAALEVVKRRLDAVGLGDFCLELHSDQTSKRAVMDQLKRSFDAAAAATPPAWAAHAAALQADRQRLNAIAASLGEATPPGISPREAVSRLIGLRHAPAVTLDFGPLGGLDPVGVAARREAVDQLAHAAAALRAPPPHHPWRGVGRATWTPAAERAIAAAVRDARAATADRQQAEGDAADTLGLTHPNSAFAADTQAAVAQRLLASSAPPRALLDADLREVGPRLRGWADTAAIRRTTWGALAERWTDALLALDLAPLQRRYGRWADAFFLVAWFFLWGARGRLRATARGRLAHRVTTRDDLDLAVTVQAHDAALAECDGEAQALLGAVWRGPDTDPAAVARRIEEAESIQHAVIAATADLDAAAARAAADHLLDLASSRHPLLAPHQPRGQALIRVQMARAADDATLDAADALLALDLDRALGETADTAAAAWERMAASLPALREWTAWQAALAPLPALGLGPLGDALVDGALGEEALSDAFERALAAWVWEAAAEADPALAAFRGVDHAALRARFIALDRRAQELAREEIRARIAARVPDLGAPGAEMALLRRQMTLKTRHMPLRRLFARLPDTLRRVQPCLLMSPLSVARYLDPGLPGTDLVVFDEASQIPPWDAVGAIARAQQVVVVGDTRQLPPTTFFSRGEDDDPDPSLDDEDLIEMESILEEAVAAGLPELGLQWHYRSRHESLIAFSNHHYYDDRLHTFPSAWGAAAGLGVERVDVPHGSYDRGHSRTNAAEAEALVAELLDLLRRPPGRWRSVGVVTFSMTQQRLVEDLLDAARLADPSLEPFFSDDHPEPVFVKNLERVQGDERDVMLFSVCYGPDPTGRVSLNFGPLNRTGGERRLNVAITRARERLVVFSTLRSDQIDLRRTRSVGVAHLKSFLDYAERGPAAIDGAEGPRGHRARPDPLLVAVEQALIEDGHTVERHVGRSETCVDLAVVDPVDSGRFVLGVRLDGPQWHDRRQAAARERLQQGALQALGWQLHRVWSIDWWLDPDGERDRLRGAVAAAQAEVGPQTERRRLEPQPSPAPIPPGEPLDLAQIEPLAPPPFAEPWRLPVLAEGGTPEAFYATAARSTIAAQLAQIAQMSGPLAFDVAARHLAASWGLRALGARIRRCVEAARLSIAVAARPDLRDGVLWPVGVEPADWRGLRLATADASPRDFTDIAVEECANAAAWVLGSAKSLGREELAHEAARLLGAGRPGARIDAHMQPAIARLVADGRAHFDGDRVTLPPPPTAGHAPPLR